MGFLDRVGRFIDDVLLLPEETRLDLEEAEALLDAGVGSEAEDRFLQILSSRPGLARAWVGLARARELHGNLPGACEAMEQALDLAPEEGELALVAARLSLHVGQIDAAIEHARTAAHALAAQGGHELAEACALLGRAERQRGRPDRAVRELRKALSLAPDDTELRVELVECLCEAGRATTALAGLAALESEVSLEQAQRIGLSLFRGGAWDVAERFLRRGAEADSVASHRALSEIALARNEHVTAEDHARRAVALGGGPEALETLGQVLFRRERFRDAAEAYLAASGARDLRLLYAAARCIPLDDAAFLARLADQIEAIAGRDDSVVIAMRAWSALNADPSTAPAIPEAIPESRAQLAMGEWLIRAGRYRDCLDGLDRWAASLSFVEDRRLADEHRRRALRGLWTSDDGQVDLAAAIDAVSRFAEERDLLAVKRQAAALRDELDRPLLLAVLGEFNAGKSTLINAFIGAEVAPMGIVPTTATLNVLRGGAKRRVRVVRSDGTTREGPFEDLRELLKQGEREGVDRIEIVMPEETLDRVWILDTPGTNALDADHERLAQEAIHRADAVLWVLDAAQAGKLTESKIFFGIRRSGRLAIPVLNKKDRLTDDQLERVRDQVSRVFALSEPPIALSARSALRGRIADDHEVIRASGFSDLRAWLEKHVFSCAEILKRQACSTRLGLVLDEALATETDATANDRERCRALEAVSEPTEIALERSSRALDHATRWFDAALNRAFHEAAEEVMAFVRPRRHRFARHGVDAEDRRFLYEVLDQRTAAAAEDCQHRLIEDLRGTFSELASVLGMDREELDARLRAHMVPALNGFAGFQRGLVAGGALARFFDRVLSQAELDVASVSSGLLTARADLRTELRPALDEALARFAVELESERREALRAGEHRIQTISSNVYEPLRALRAALSGLGVPPNQGSTSPRRAVAD